MFVRLLLAVLTFAVAIGTASAQPFAPAATPGEASFVVSGKGWGHGVGMSQWGAYGMARAGRTYEEILSHYYTGIELGRTSTKDVRVLLAEGRRAVTIASPVRFTVRDPSGAIHRLPPGPLTIRPKLELPAEKGGNVAVASPLVFRPGKAAPLALDGRAYRGKLQIVVQKGFLRVVDIVPLESYLQGVVAGEMPYQWPLEALRAQAVAARSYALANLVHGKPFDLYADVRSQVYLGVAGERPQTTEAVQTTAREVVLYGGEVASTLYFSSSGGRTASAADVFGTQIPYLLARPDPWDKASPNHRWGPVVLGARTVQSKLGIGERVVDAVGMVTPSGRLRTLSVVTTTGAEAIPASVVRTALGLRSTWLSIGVLRLDPPGGTHVFGSSVELSGISRGLASPVLAASPDGAAWARANALARAADGTFVVAVKPVRSMRYRIEVEGAASPALLIQVTPRLQLVTAEPGVLAGSVRPKLVGARISVERRNTSGWSLVKQATVDESGAFRVALELVPGSYRARIPASDALEAGVSPTLEVAG